MQAGIQAVDILHESLQSMLDMSLQYDATLSTYMDGASTFHNTSQNALISLDVINRHIEKVSLNTVYTIVILTCIPL